jgi:aconitate hydratase
VVEAIDALESDQRWSPEGRKAEAAKFIAPLHKNLMTRYTALPDEIAGPVLLKVGDDISTDEIMPAGARVLPYRSNIPEISKFVFSQVDESFYGRAFQNQQQGFFIIGGDNYGQGSSREHAAIAPRYLGLRVVIAKSFARIHRQNLVNFGILPLTFVHPDDFGRIHQGDVLEIEHAVKPLRKGEAINVKNATRNTIFTTEHGLTARQIAAVLEGGLINMVRKRQGFRAET